ncbi:MAG: translation initiation factor IF-2 subunit beta [Thermoprotei archaeon]|nr:MAG: translation initiation factor IF-2 subunit beta [Thermoprotei archaeon]
MTSEQTYYDYDWLLERAYSMLPKKAFEKRRERFVIPKADVIVSGKRTFITNFKQICETINRDPKVLLKFLLKELGSPGEVADQAAMIQGEFPSKTIITLINRFVKSYVICPVCNSPDTMLVKEKKIMYLKCMACGATSPVRPI